MRGAGRTGGKRKRLLSEERFFNIYISLTLTITKLQFGVIFRYLIPGNTARKNLAVYSKLLFS